MKPQRWAVFISGRGSNAASLFDELMDINVVICVSSKANALGVLKAKRSGVPVLILDKKIDWKKLDAELRARAVSRIFLLGFMKILPQEFVQAWQSQIINLHPSLLPEFPGINAIELSYSSGKALGVSIHEVVTEMDAGPLIWQKKVQDSAIAGSHTLTSSEAHFLISRTEQSLVKRSVRSLNMRQQATKGIS